MAAQPGSDMPSASAMLFIDSAVPIVLQWPTEELLKRATDVAAFVCTCAGATPRLPEQLVAPFADALDASAGRT